MSWFKRAPRRHEPQKHHVYHPPHPGAATVRMAKEARVIDNQEKKQQKNQSL